MTIFTIGHSTRTLEELVELLEIHGVRQLADIRTVPRSRRHPQFWREALTISLPARGIAYTHLPALGGLRKTRPNSSNTAWQNASFRGYADYMQTPAFEQGLEELLAYASIAPTTVMCAEATWWRCHRRLVADALVARGLDVRHIMSATPAAPHQMTPFACVEAGRVTYPGLF
ncbi:MAG TPA: DUF488 domain-containing protein [Vicinamibacterales bacterium]